VHISTEEGKYRPLRTLIATWLSPIIEILCRYSSGANTNKPNQQAKSSRMVTELVLKAGEAAEYNKDPVETDQIAKLTPVAFPYLLASKRQI
jgi:hypothetical protein